MDMELFEKIRDGIIVETNEFKVSVIRRGTDDWKKDNAYNSILHLISSGYISGESCADGNYRNLKVTSKGEEVYKFWSTPIKNIGKPTPIEVMRNGIISIFAGKIVYWVVVTILLILVPTFSQTARGVLINVLNWVITLLS